MATNAKTSASKSSKMTDAPKTNSVTNNSKSFETMGNSVLPGFQQSAEPDTSTQPSVVAQPNVAAQSNVATQSEVVAQSEVAAQPKQSRTKTKPRRSNIEDYRKDFLSPIKLTQTTKHQVAISNDTFDRIERIARHFGGRGYVVGSFVEHILIDHLEAYADIYDGWYSQLGKSL